jgi:hypothetical protein
MRVVLTAITEAAPRACDLCPYSQAARVKDSPSNIGRKVVLRGLVSRQDLNGCYATIVDEPRFGFVARVRLRFVHVRWTWSKGRGAMQRFDYKVI